MTTLTSHGYSKISDFEVCPRYYYYRYVRNLRSRKFEPAPSIGTMFHAARATLLETGDLQEAFKTIRECATEYVGQDGFAEAAEDTVIYVADMIEGYHKHWKDNKLQRTGFEVAFDTEIDGFKITGRIDDIVILDNGVWIGECKTTGYVIPTFVRMMALDAKTTCYVWAAQKLTGKMIQGALLDIIYKKPRRAGFEYHREILPRTEHNIKEWERDTVYKLNRIKECYESGVWPCYYVNCGNRFNKPCPFLDLCRFGATDELIAAQFRVEEPDVPTEGEGGEQH